MKFIVNNESIDFFTSIYFIEQEDLFSLCISILRHFFRVVIDPTSGCDCIAHACSFEHFVTLDEELEVTMDIIAEVEVIG